MNIASVHADSNKKFKLKSSARVNTAEDSMSGRGHGLQTAGPAGPL